MKTKFGVMPENSKKYWENEIVKLKKFKQEIEMSNGMEGLERSKKNLSPLMCEKARIEKIIARIISAQQILASSLDRMIGVIPPSTEEKGEDITPGHEYANLTLVINDLEYALNFLESEIDRSNQL
jgi:hypothetical protein